MGGAGEEHPRTPSDDAVGTDVMTALEVVDGGAGVTGEPAGVADAQPALQPAHRRPAGAEPQRGVRWARTDSMTMRAAGGLRRAVRGPASRLWTAYCPPGRGG